MKDITLLVVEDDSTRHEILCLNLSKEGYRIQEAADGAATLEFIERTLLI
ncbi:MAG: hypothetical protein JXA01_01380 [Dehalococcoidia bacterium]|nr:hypothetical protein [Dehalococcoidia bacterium]